MGSSWGISKQIEDEILFQAVVSTHINTHRTISIQIQISVKQPIECHQKNKGLPRQSYGFSSSYVWMWELDYKESWAPKNWCFWTVVLEKTWESLDYKEIQPVNPKGNQSWIFIGRTDGETETLILWPPDVKNWFIWKDPDAGKDWGWRRRGWQRMRWMASPTQWTWVWVTSRSWWWTGRPGVLQSMGSQTGRPDWVTELTSPPPHLL